MDKVNKSYIEKIIKEILSEEKADRCLRIARQKYDKPSAYRSGAIVRCRKGDIWKDLKEETLNTDIAKQKIDQLPQGRLFDDAKNIESIFKKSQHNWSNVIELFEKNKDKSTLQYVNIKDIYITQPNIQANKVKNMLDKLGKAGNINVVEFKNGEKVIYDGHHRLVANWALENSKIKANVVQLGQYEDNMKEADDPQAGKAAPYGSGYAKVKQAIQELLQEDESLHKWFSRKGAKGKAKGWVDCNAPDGKGGYKSCGRQEGEKRSKYPACRPTPSQCKTKGKEKTWGKTK